MLLLWPVPRDHGGLLRDTVTDLLGIACPDAFYRLRTCDHRLLLIPWMTPPTLLINKKMHCKLAYRQSGGGIFLIKFPVPCVKLTITATPKGQ